MPGSHVESIAASVSLEVPSSSPRYRDRSRRDEAMSLLAARSGVEAYGSNIQLNLDGPDASSRVTGFLRQTADLDLRIVSVGLSTKFSSAEPLRQSEWYRVQPRRWFATWCTQHPGAHVSRSPSPLAGPVVSEPCRALIESSGFRGARFLPARHIGRTRATPWFQLVSEHTMSRGIDHPWREPVYPDDLTLAVAPTEIGVDQLRTATLPEPIKLLLAVDGARVLLWHGGFLRRGCPDADFAYRRFMPGVGRAFYCSSRARDCLLDAGMAEEQDFGAVAVHAEAPEGTVAFDDLADPGPPEMTPQEIESETAEVMAAAAALPTWDDSEPISSLVPALVKRFKEWPCEHLDPQQLAAAAKEHDILMPKRYLEICGCLKDGDYFLPHSLLARDQGSPASIDDEPLKPERETVFAGTPDGDWLTFDVTSTLMPKDAPVLFWDHEQNRITRYWPSVGAFLHSWCI